MPPPPPEPVRASPDWGTLIEPDDTPAAPPPPKLAKLSGATPVPAAPPPAAATPFFRPTARPSMALLTVCDDGSPDGEVVRLRADRYVVGRTDGDVRVPHDDLVSARHLEIVRQVVGGRPRWVVNDLGSTNGLFLRVTRTYLGDGAEFLVGRGRYRFEHPDAEPAAPEQPARTGATVGWGSAAPSAALPILSEVLPGGAGTRTRLAAAEYWIGADPTCHVARPDDPYVEARHAKLSRAADGRWEVRNNKAVNGVWLRVPQIVVGAPVRFRIGEQLFRLEVL